MNCEHILQAQMLEHHWIQIPAVMGLLIVIGVCMGFPIGVQFGKQIDSLCKRWLGNK